MGERKLKKYTFYYFDGNDVKMIDLNAKSEPGAYNQLYQDAGKHIMPIKMYLHQPYPQNIECYEMIGE